jgi:hypothetical protein
VGEQLHARFQWCDTDPATLNIYNVSWSPVAKKKVMTLVGDNTLDLNLRSFAPGVYYAYLEIDGDSTKLRSKLMKFVVLR